MFRLSLKILWSDLNAIPQILATSHLVTLLLLRTTAFLQPIFLSVLLVDGHPEHLASSTEVTLLLNVENHTKTCVLALFALNTLLSTLLKFLLQTQFTATSDSYTLFFKIYHCQGIPESQTEHTHVLHKVLHNNQMCNSLIPSRKWLSEFYHI